MRTQNYRFARYTVLITFLAFMVGLGILAVPSKGLAQNGTVSDAVSIRSLIHGMNALPAAALYPAANQDAGQVAPPAAAPSQPKKVELPEGDGKAIATEYCQDCHQLTNVTKVRKALDEWKDTVQTMMDRGARLPQENVDTLVQYLAKNFGPQTDAPAAAAPVVAAAQAAPSPAAPSADATPSAPAQPKTVELPDGDGKTIATENCQVCHRLTNLTKAHKTADEWKDTVQTMIDRGADVPADKVDTLVQYLSKNFGPKVAAAPASGTPSTSTQSQ